MDRILTEQIINEHLKQLQQEGKNQGTLEKYRRDLYKFYYFLPQDKKVTKEAVLAYRDFLKPQYRDTSICSMLAALNVLFENREWYECRLKRIYTQQAAKPVLPSLSLEEYQRLLTAAGSKDNQRLSLILQTLYATGMRITDLPCITVESLEDNTILIERGRRKEALEIPEELTVLLMDFAAGQGIRSGPIFLSRSGKPVNRSNLWSEMKKLCAPAEVAAEKVYPQNLKHLYAEETRYKRPVIIMYPSK